jgi:hypothetical protein
MYMENRKERIENDVPFVEFDFSSLYWILLVNEEL